MDITSKTTNGEVCSFLASRIRHERQRQGYSQEVMAKKSGIPLRTYKRIELTGTGSIQNLIIILRTFERIRAVEILFPPPIQRPRTNVDRLQRVVDVVKAR